MRQKITGLVATIILFVLCSSSVIAQKAELTSQQLSEIKAVDLSSFGKFKASIMPLIKEMGTKQIIGLGEGTHGTAEFYTYRFYITRILIEDFGYNKIALENDATEVWQLNQKLAGTENLSELMKKYLLTLWQNEETKALFSWVKKYNKTHKKKVSIHGIDYPAQIPDVMMIKEMLAKAPQYDFTERIATLQQAANMQDEAWVGMNKPGFKADWKTLGQLAKKAYATADSMEIAFKQLEIDQVHKDGLLLAIANVKQGFEPFYRQTPAIARDSIMAYNTAQLIQSNEDRVVIWAHNAHLGKVTIYNNAVGGTGGFLLKQFPGKYYVMGTGTSEGTFGGTKDARAVNDSAILSYELEKPITGSWEELFSSSKASNFYIRTAAFNIENATKPLRFVGYGTKSGASSYDATNLSHLFDSFLLLRSTHSPTPLK